MLEWYTKAMLMKYRHKNISGQDLSIEGIGVVKAGEVIDAPENFHNANFEKVESEKKEDKKTDGVKSDVPKK